MTERLLPAGATAVVRGLSQGRPWYEQAVRILESGPSSVTSARWPGAATREISFYAQSLRTGDRALREAARGALARGDWELASSTWQWTGVLERVVSDRWVSISRMFDSDGALLRWYVNFQRPPAWRPDGWDTCDLARRVRKTTRRLAGAMAQWRIMANVELVTAADVELMQGLAQRVTAVRPDLISAGASYGELAWIWGQGQAAYRATWPRRLWFSGAELVAWAWAFLPRQVRRNDGSVREVTGAELTYQVHPDHAGLVDEVIDWYDEVAAGLERTVFPCAGDEFAVRRWAAHGYETDTAELADDGGWTQLNGRDLIDIEQPALPDGFRFRTADEAGPRAAVQAHLDAWAPSSYTPQAYESVRQTAAYRGDLHILVEAPDGTMAASAIMWLDEANKSAEFEPVGTHPDYRRRGLARAMMLHGMQLARAAAATHMTVVCEGAPGHPAARELYYGLGFRELSRDAPLIRRAG